MRFMYLKKALKKVKEAKGWDKDHWIYQGVSNNYNSFWRTMVMSHYWQLWKADIKAHEGWDVDECEECGFISPEHFNAFIDFCIKSYGRIINAVK